MVGDSETAYAQFPVRKKDGSLVTEKKQYLERIPAGQAIRGKVLYRDRTRDLAIVQLDKCPPDTPALPLAKESVQGGRPGLPDRPVRRRGTWSCTTTEGTVRSVGVEDLSCGGREASTGQGADGGHDEPGPGGRLGGPLLDRRAAWWPAWRVDPPGRRSRCQPGVDVTEVRAFLAEKKVNIPAPPVR